MAIFFTLVGFAFKVSAVPFHFWAPDSYEGAPTPVTAFLSVASKTGGFVALLSLVYVGFFGRGDAWQPILWVLAAASMTVGNLVALRQTNVVRMLAYSSIAQGGFMLVPFAVANQGDGSARPEAFSATVVYLLIYAVMNLGAFAAAHRHRPQDPLGRDRHLRRPVQLRPGAGRDDVALPLLAGRHPAARAAGTPSSWSSRP